MINYYRNQVYELKQLKRRFETLKDDLNGSVISSLNAVNSSLNEANTLLLSSYTIDGEGADNKSISNNASNIEKTSSYITSNVIPAIDSEIRKINNKIYYFNELIEEQEESNEE
ncbi:MAG: hypothetical protein IJB21_05120 [Bacilli bacterium]|nr:hypothetical protein [Bacilli bacterium]